MIKTSQFHKFKITLDPDRLYEVIFLLLRSMIVILGFTAFALEISN